MPVTPAPDAELVRSSQSGERAAFGCLYQRYARVVHGILLARVPRATVDDLVHDVFIRALERLGALRDPAAFPGWIATMARRQAIDHLRRTKASVPVPEHLATSDPPAAEAEEALAALRSLPQAYRETLVLRLVEGLTGPEIARQTGMTEGSVRVNLHRGMKLLRERLGLDTRRFER